MRTRFAAAAWILIGFSTAAGAAEIVGASVDRTEDRYHVEFVVMIEGEAERVHGIITDYAHLDELSPTVVESRLLSGRRGGEARIEVILRPCVLMVFCKTITKVSDAQVRPDMMGVRYLAVPGLGDFEEGRETITMTQESIEGKPIVRFSYSAVLKPGFYIPPFIGPWLVRRAIVDDLEASSRRVERMLRRNDR